MEKILDFLISNWKLLALGVVVILEAVLIVLNRRKPVKVVDSILSDIRDVLPSLIVAAEESYKNGQQQGEHKLLMVLELVHNYLRLKYGFTTEQVIEYDDYIKSKVEAILTCPQKKGASYEN